MHPQVALSASRIRSDGEVSLGSRPFFGERVSGDGMVVRRSDGQLLLAIIDVLGHGAEAHQLACQIEQWLEREPLRPVASQLQLLHQHFKGSRGAAVGLALVSSDGMLHCASIGNTLLRVLQPELTLFPGQPGTVGYILPSVQERCLQLLPGALLLLTTDGVQEHLPASLLGSWARLPTAKVSSLLMSNYAKWHDDAACIAVRWEP